MRKLVGLALGVGLASSSAVGQVRAGPDWDQPPEALDIAADERATLESGAPVYRTSLERGASRGAAMILVQASPSVIWSTIHDFDAYVSYMPYITESVSTGRSPAPPAEALEWQMELTTMGLVTRYRVENRYYASRSYMTWAMIPQGGTPLQQATGYWRVTPWGDGRSLVVYCADVATSWWVPTFVHEKAAARLPTMVELIQRRVEG